MRLFALIRYILRRYHWFPREMTSQKRAQKIHTDDVPLPRSGWCFWLVLLYGKFTSISQKHYPDLGSDTSSLWNFCAFLSTSFAGKPVMASQNVGCFLRLNTCWFTKAMQRKSDVVHMHSLAFTFAFWVVGVYQSLILVAWANKSNYNRNRTEATTFLKTRWP